MIALPRDGFRRSSDYTGNLPEQEPEVVAEPVSQTEANFAPVRESHLRSAADDQTPYEARQVLGWAPRFIPRLQGLDRYALFRKICDDLSSEMQDLDDFVFDGSVGAEGVGRIAEIEHLLDKLYDCNWGEGETLQRVVVAIQSQVNNAEWTTQHVGFLKAVVRFLRARYLISEQTVDECYRLIEKHGLDPFRGTVSETEIVKRYRIVEVQEE